MKPVTVDQVSLTPDSISGLLLQDLMKSGPSLVLTVLVPTSPKHGVLVSLYRNIQHFSFEGVIPGLMCRLLIASFPDIAVYTCCE